MRCQLSQFGKPACVKNTGLPLKSFQPLYLSASLAATALALAQVMAAWSGLGYYRRARLLWECARVVQRQHDGVLPQSAHALAQLPGIGRSTAAAIASLCWGEPVPILDANVRRVLTRHAGLGAEAAATALWDLAAARLPVRDVRARMPIYTQGMMDLGALVCTTRSPRCAECPVRHDCHWRSTGGAAQIPPTHPAPRATAPKPALHWWLLILQRADGAVWLQTRPSLGIWAGLRCPPCLDRGSRRRLR